MKKESRISSVHEEVYEINHLIGILATQVRKIEEAYKNKDFKEFNSLKKDLIQTEKRMHELIR